MDGKAKDDAGTAGSRGPTARLAVAVPFLAALAGLIGQLAHGRAVVWTPDSLGFTWAGLLMAAGESPAGQLFAHNLGYPWLTGALAPLGGLRAMVTFQSILAAAGLTALLLVLRTVVRSRWAFCVIGLLSVLAAYASDSFVIYAQTLDPDSVFGSCLLLALLLFLTAWRRMGPARALFMTGALALSFAAYLVEPTGVLVMVLCVASLGLIAWRSPRDFLDRRVILGLAALAALVIQTQTYQARWKTLNVYPASLALFAAHMNIVAFDLDRATPEHRALREKLDGILGDRAKSPALGFDMERCNGGALDCQALIRKAAEADHMDPGAFMARRVFGGIARHPKAYAAKVARQVGFFLTHPNPHVHLVYPSAISEDHRNRIAPYAAQVRYPAIELNRSVGSWFSERHPILARVGKGLIFIVLKSLPLVAVTSALAALAMLFRRRRIGGAVGRAFLAVSAFTVAAILSVAIPLSFDEAHLAGAFALLTYLFWVMGVFYLAKIAAPAMAWLGEATAPLAALAAPASLKLRRVQVWADSRLDAASRGVKAAIITVWLRARGLSQEAPATDSPATVVSVVANLALAICALLSVGLMVLQLGVAHVDQTSTGPFPGEQAAGSQLRSVDIKPLGALSCCLRSPSDGVGRTDSRLRLWVNDKEILPAHTAHADIRTGGQGFSHWGNQVLFALPKGTDNSRQTKVRLFSPLKPVAWTLLFPLLTIALFVGLHGRRTLAWIIRSLPVLMSVLGNLALATGALLSVGLLALQLGAAHVDQTFTGPFAGEQTEGSQLKSIQLKPLGVLSCCLKAPADRVGHGNDSQLRLWVNDREILPPHTPGTEIRKGHPGFSHWVSEVYFALPPGTANSSQTTVRLSTPLKPDAWTLLFPVITIALFIGLHGRRTMAWIRGRSSSASLAMKSPYLVLFAFGWTVVVAGAAYLATVLWGLVTGEALAPAIPFRSELGKAAVDALDPAIPLCLLILAVFGVASGWLAAQTSNTNLLRKAELSGLRWLRRYGLFCLVMFYLASVGATWAGTWRSGTSQAILGLVPAFDSWGYFSSAHSFLHDGRMGELLSRRPLAGALRVATFGVSDFRYDVVLLWQVVAMAASTFFATMTIARWRGLWAGVVFIALAYIAVRTHLATLLTEPLGLPIAFVALGFLAEAFRSSSKTHALLALGLLTAALWVRPGAMFVIPGLALWFAWTFHETPRQKLKGFLIACAPIVAIIVVDKLLGVFFARPAFKGELADALCGLSLGGDWSACLTTYRQEFERVSGSYDAQIAWLHAKTLYNIQHDPGTFLTTVFVREPLNFWSDLPRVLLQGYSSTGVPETFPSMLWLLAVPVLGVLSLRKRDARVEIPFWAVVCIGLTTSAMLVYSSDGIRAMAVTYPLLGLFVAAVFSSPVAPQIGCTRTARREVRLGAILTVAATAGLFVFLPIVRVIYPSPRASLARGESPSNTTVVGSLARSAGVLVVADDQPLPHGVPSVHFSRFAEIVRVSHAQDSQGIIDPKAPTLPFGFIEMPSLISGDARIWITPPEMLTRRDVRAWRIVFEGWNPTGQLNSQNWFHVVSATPYLKPLGK